MQRTVSIKLETNVDQTAELETLAAEFAHACNLVSCHASNVGYRRWSLIRASSVVNCQWTFA